MKMLLGFILAAYFSLGMTFANDTAMNSGSYGPEPMGIIRGQESPIRLVEENLKFEVGKLSTEVNAVFHFRNTLMDKPVTQLTGFPDLLLGVGEKDARKYDFHISPMDWMKTRVDGKVVKTNVVRRNVDYMNGYWIPAAENRAMNRVAWHVTPMAFEPGGEVTLERKYRSPNGSQGMRCNNWFIYTTKTGAPWRGRIGRLTLRVRLLDGIKVNDLDWNVDADDDTYPYHMWPQRKYWKVISPSEMELEWKNFEPLDKKTGRGFFIVRNCSQAEINAANEWEEGAQKEWEAKHPSEYSTAK